MKPEEQEDFYKRLLLTKTQQERTALFNKFSIPTSIAANKSSSSNNPASGTTPESPSNQSNSTTSDPRESIY